MKTKLFVLAASFIIVLSLLLASCSSTSTSATSQTSKPASTSSPATSAPTASSTASWWTKFGTPQYGGTITVRTTYINGGSFDPAATPLPGLLGAGGFASNVWSDSLAFPDWTLNPNTYAYPTGFAPVKYLKGLLMDTWQQSDPLTITVHLRKGVTWQNKAPANGREFTADDIVFNFDRLLGTGSGYSQPNMFWGQQFPNIKKAVAVDKYTVNFQLNQPGAIAIYQLLGANYFFVPSEWVALGGPPASGPPAGGPPADGGAPAGPPGPPGAPGAGGPPVATGPLAEWQNVVGTGPWVLADFVQGTSMTFAKNTAFWGYDERFPRNKLPYADKLVQLAIADPSTALAALRSGKIDMWTDAMGSLSWQQAQQLAKTNPDIQQAKQPKPAATLYFKCDNKPFTDINVRKALNMAVDRKTIAASFYGGYSDGEPCGAVGPAIKGWSTPYADWPQDIKDSYTFNPQKAKQLLATAGFASGFKTNIVASSNADTQLLQLVKSEFNDIGVDMTINVMDPSVVSAFIAAGKQDQMVYNDAGAGMLNSPTVSLPFYLSSSIPATNNTFNYDKDYDALFAKMQNAADPEDMAKLSAQIDLYVIQHFWQVPVSPTNTQIVVWQSWLKGYSGQLLFDPAWSGELRARFWIDPSSKK